MYDGEKLQILLQKNKNIKLKDAISYSMMDPTDGFKFLISIKNDVDLEAYAMYVRILT